MKISANDFVQFVCADCLFASPANEGLAKPLSPHSHFQYDADHPMGTCRGEIREINVVDFIRRRRDSDKVDAEINKLNEQFQSMNGWQAADKKLLQSLNGKFRLPAVAQLFRSALENLDSALEQSQIPLLARIEVLKLSPDHKPVHIERNRVFVEKLLRSEEKWEAWQNEPLLEENPDANYSLIPYPVESDLAKVHACVACHASVQIENIDTPRISAHSHPRKGSVCLNSNVALRRRDLCTISENCQSVNSGARADLVPVKLDPEMMGQTLILRDGTVMSYGSSAHLVKSS
jgi:hypothetical protein